eukprot:7826455-Lingulodinium_polyedra.AAC.1
MLFELLPSLQRITRAISAFHASTVTWRRRMECGNRKTDRARIARGSNMDRTAWDVVTRAMQYNATPCPAAPRHHA